MADVINLVPDLVNIVGYSGDTLTVNVIISDPAYDDGAVWAAQVRCSTGSSVVLEDFGITLLPSGDGACLTLTPLQTRRLNDSGTIRRGQGCTVYQTFDGVWDVQILKPDGTVTTLARGSIQIVEDVTRVGP